MRHPACQFDIEECRVRSDGAPMTTLIAWRPERDGSGNITTVNPNTITQPFSCPTCGRHWFEITRMGHTEFRDIDP